MAKAKEETKKEVKKENIDLSKVKEELKEYIEVQVKKGISEELEKSNKKLLREKTKKIICKNIIIIILLAIICFLLFLLYEAKFFDKYFDNEYNVNNNQVEKETNTNEEKKEEEKKEISLDELKRTYSYLLDNIYISENSTYVNDYYSGKLTNEIKNYIALNNLKEDNLLVEENYNIIDEEKLKEAFLKLFNDYENISFDFNGNKVRYLSKLNSYITDTIIDKLGTNIEREIININVDDNIVITTVEGLVLDNRLFNVLENAEIENYNNEPLSRYRNVLSVIKYTFKDGKLLKIEKSE